ncbi:MAG: FAD:protein FMN transferase [Marinilabiliaceae bacterium]|jgi:thiamine biosynthesis lipoprotein|nr:FAD:protein FMN transferase [Marinilabiliaceae bacterium]
MKYILSALFFIFLFTSGCKESAPDYYNIRGFAQGTTYSIIYDGESGLEPGLLKNEVDTFLHLFDLSLSAYNKDSRISALNRGSWVEADKWMIAVYNKALEVWKLSDGAFDITMGPLVNAWGFGPESQEKYNVEMLDSLMELVGMNRLKLEGSRLVKENSRMYIDVNAIAQGYSVDLLTSFLIEKGVSRCLVELGGEIRATGSKYPGTPWKVAIDKPIDGNNIPGDQVQAIIKLENNSLATSGNYRKYYEDNDGLKYSHTIDPVTGRPVQHKLLSATIIAGDCISADAFATACMVKGLEGAKEMLASNPSLDAYLVYSDENGEFRTWYTDRMLSFIEE